MVKYTQSLPQVWLILESILNVIFGLVSFAVQTAPASCKKAEKQLENTIQFAKKEGLQLSLSEKNV